MAKTKAGGFGTGQYVEATPKKTRQGSGSTPSCLLLVVMVKRNAIGGKDANGQESGQRRRL